MQKHTHEIDLFLFFKTLYDGKWIISIFVILSLILGTGFYLKQKHIFKSEIKLSIDNIPPFYKRDGKPDLNKILSDIKKIFYSAKIFEDWKKVNTNILIKFNDFSMTTIVDGTIIQQDPSKIFFEVKKKNNFSLITRSNELDYLDNVYNYIVHVNSLLELKYKLETISALSIIKKELNTLSKIQNVDYMAFKIYLMNIEKGAKPFIINRPTMPVKVTPKLSVILSLSVLLGSFLSCFFIIVRNIFYNRKN